LLTFMVLSTKANTCFHLLYNYQQWCQALSTTRLVATLNISFGHSLCTWQNKIKAKGFKCFLISFNLPECKSLQFQWQIQSIHNVVVVAKTMEQFLFQFLVIKILFLMVIQFRYQVSSTIRKVKMWLKSGKLSSNKEKQWYQAEVESGMI